MLLAREVARLRGELLLDVAQRIGRRRANAGQFLLQPLLTRRQLRQACRATLSRRVSATRTSCSVMRDALALLGQDPRCLGDRLFQRRQRRLRGTLAFGCRFARGERRFELAFGVALVGGERGFLSGDGAQRLGQLRDLLREARLRFAGE